ncbi:helix-turn-helix domain-containing protein [Streptomyces sp. NPDC047042]|uniref:helix-turn-helix domain-containing protein n=1 Tax=Streptomyces sp. NPDC047042 TaxID=3154807 RepID=UPI00340FCEB6
MVRRREPVPPSARYEELAQWLRTLRQRAGLTYRQMSELTERSRVAGPAYSAVTLCRADSGTALPRQQVVETYAQVCGASRREARLRWERAAVGAESAAGCPQPQSAPRAARRLELVYHPAHLLQAMHQVRLAAGQPSLREMQKRARELGAGPLPRSTVADVLAGLRMPSEELLVAFVQACGHQGQNVAQWQRAWARALNAEAG